MKELINKLKSQPRQGYPTAPGSRNPAGPGQSAGSGTPDAAPATGLTPDQINQIGQDYLDNYLATQQSQSQITSTGRTYTAFDLSYDIITKQKETITSGMWSNGSGSLSTFYTSSTQTTSQRRYYTDVYQGVPTTEGSAVQFSVAYGNAEGSGSSDLGTEENPASRAVYGQHRQLLLEKDASRFVTAGSGSTDSIYVVNIKRNRLKERLDEGNVEFSLHFMSASLDTNATGSNMAVSSSVIHTLIDDSSLITPTLGRAGRIYNIVSGSLDDGPYNPSDPVYYGLSYPDYGIMVLDGKMLDQQLNYQTNTTSDSEGDNHFRLFHSISGSSAAGGNGFLARNSEKVSSSHYFVRVKNGEYNFSNNISYTTGSEGLFAQSTFFKDPKTYITTIGLYNDRQELLAIAKLSKPLLKSYSREALIRVKLDY